MKYILVLALFILILLNTKAERSELLFDDNWKFNKDDITNTEGDIYDNKNWHTINLPDKWSVEDLPNQ